MKQELRYYSESDLTIFHGTPFSAGLDLPVWVGDKEKMVIEPGKRVAIPTGITVEIPEGYYGKVDSRSSTSKLNLVLLCTTIDNDYRGVIHVVFQNIGTEPVTVSNGDYLAQLVIIPYMSVEPVLANSVEELTATERGDQGFGHTGNTIQQY